MVKIDELHNQVKQLRDNLRANATQAEDKQEAALCETAYEVVAGLEKAFDHWINKSEKAWQ